MSVYWRKERNCFWYDFQIEGKRYQGVCLNPFDKTQNAKNITQAKQYETLIKIDIKKPINCLNLLIPSPKRLLITIKIKVNISELATPLRERWNI